MYRKDPDGLATARAELVRYGERLLADAVAIVHTRRYGMGGAPRS